MTAVAILTFLAEWAIRATIFGAATAAVLWMCRVRNVHVRHTVWTAVLVSVLLMPLAGRLLPDLPLRLPAASRTATLAYLPSDPNGVPTLPYRTAPVQPTPGVAGRLHAPEIAIAVWLAVSTALLSRLLMGLWLSRRLVRDSSMVEGAVRESPHVRVPITVGLFRPIIVLPSDWRCWSDARLRAALEHEKSHGRRFDPLRHLIASLYCCVCWFHPLAWWLKAQLTALADAASDDAALAAVDRIAYAETLLAFFAVASHRVHYHGTAMATRRIRADRIDRVLDANRPLERPLGLTVAASLVSAAVAAGLIVASAHPVAAQATRPKSVIVTTKKRVAPCEGKEQYRRWVREDVAYIISTDERFAFTALESEAACDAFIERFWAQRGAAFRQEHARRLAYVNKHYSAAVPGWRTDRGRIYILYGPPDRIESHPGSQESVAIEKWNYRHLPSIGDNITIEFIDRAGDGDYRMVYLPDPPSRAAMQQRQDLAEVVREERLPNGLAVRVHLDRTALISVPVDWSFGDANLYGRITDKSRRSVWVFEETVRIPTNAHSGTAYITMREKRLDPGTYRLQIVAKPLSRERSAEAKRHELQFKVN